MLCHFTHFQVCLIFDSGKYIVFNGLLQLFLYTKEKNAILFTCPPAVRSFRDGLANILDNVFEFRDTVVFFSF
jgi:hypothetical protein